MMANHDGRRWLELWIVPSRNAVHCGQRGYGLRTADGDLSRVPSISTPCLRRHLASRLAAHIFLFSFAPPCRLLAPISSRKSILTPIARQRACHAIMSFSAPYHLRSSPSSASWYLSQASSDASSPRLHPSCLCRLA